MPRRERSSTSGGCPAVHASASAIVSLSASGTGTARSQPSMSFASSSAAGPARVRYSAARGRSPCAYAAAYSSNSATTSATELLRHALVTVVERLVDGISRYPQPLGDLLMAQLLSVT